MEFKWTQEEIEIVLTDYTTGKVRAVPTVKGSEEWKQLLCVAVPQQLAARAERRRSHRHFDRTDMESFLTSKAYDILLSYDEEKNPNFEAHLRRCLALKVFTFFDDNGIERSTDYYAQRDTTSDNGDAVIFEPDSNVNEWEQLDSTIAFSDLLNSLSFTEKKLIELTMKGFSGAEIAEELNVSRMTVHRHLKKLAELPEFKSLLCDLIESKYQGQDAPFELVSTEEDYYSEKRVAQRKKNNKRKVNTYIRSTTPAQTFERVRAYKNTIRQLNENNVDLYYTAVKWTADRRAREEQGEA